ncbi:RNA-directed DNA polymerase, eukaryota [Tanacetum coccineum]
MALQKSLFNPNLNRLSDFIANHEGKFVLFDDFNEVRDESERHDTEFDRNQAQIFNTFIDHAGLFDILIGGRMFTWMNKAGTKMSKLDRFLVSHSIIDSSPDLKVTALPRGWSDHTPIMLHFEKDDYGPIPFKFLIRGFNVAALTIVDTSRLLQIKSKLLFIDDKIDSGTALEEEKVDRLNLLKEREDIQKLEDMDTVQKARIKWGCEGDDNSQIASHHDFEQKRTYQSVKGEVQVFYNITNFPTVIPHSSLNNEDNLKLEKSVSMDEIKAAVWDCGSQKAPSPDGFSLLFLKHYWDLLKDDVVAAVTHTFDTFIIPKGVNSKWRRWIKMCLHSTRASVLVNGSPSSEFLIKCGLRQGDPLSPFLFIIVMEGLHLALEDVVSSGLIHGAKVGNSDLYISHLFYANDVVIISEWNKQDMDNIIRILHVFYLASDLKINISKSHVYGLGVNSIDTGNMARDTGCSPGNIPLSYLGLPIGSNMNMIANWQHLIDRFRAIHGDEADFDFQGCNSNGIWTAIISSFSSSHARGIITSDSLFRKVGNESSIRFWKDNSDKNGPLSARYNRLFHLDSNENCVLADRFVNNTWNWNWKRSNIGSRNMAALDRLISNIGHVSFNSAPDSWSWKISNDDSFSVQATRSHIDNCLLPSLHPNTRWLKFLPRKVNIFIWRLILDRLPTRLNLSLLGIDIPSIACTTCNASMETNEHVFFECDTASNI